MGVQPKEKQMSKGQDIHYGGTIIVTQTVPGLGIMGAIAATSTAAGTAGYGPGCSLLTTTTKKNYTNTGDATTATWTITGDQTA
jgi:hypothetical protein